MRGKNRIRIEYVATGEVIAEGWRGFQITPFEGNYYISKSALKTVGMRTNYVPGICIYKFIFVWLDFYDHAGNLEKFLGWRYVLPNPLLPFIWFRVAVPANDPRIKVSTLSEDGGRA